MFGPRFLHCLTLFQILPAHIAFLRLLGHLSGNFTIFFIFECFWDVLIRNSLISSTVDIALYTVFPFWHSVFMQDMCSGIWIPQQWKNFHWKAILFHTYLQLENKATNSTFSIWLQYSLQFFMHYRHTAHMPISHSIPVHAILHLKQHWLECTSTSKRSQAHPYPPFVSFLFLSYLLEWNHERGVRLISHLWISWEKLSRAERKIYEKSAGS